MILKNLTSLHCGHRATMRTPGQLELSLCVRATLRIRPSSEPELVEDPIEQGFLSGDTFADDDLNHERELVHASDFADFKLNSEVYARGSCYPAGGPATESPVRITVGSWSKALHVSGPRTFQRGLLLGGKAGEAQPFAQMPLTWHNAYGGDGYASNPVGRGFRGEELPTVQYPDKPIKKVGSKDVVPASFEPISPNWAQRTGKRGRNYGAAWKKTRAPFYSDDFDWTYFQSAPDDQQIDGYLRGDEDVTFENLHPDASIWRTRLPGLRIRAFVKTADGRLHEPTMNLDTLFADLEDGKLYLTWRGLSPIAQLDLSDVAAVLVAQEPLAEPPVDADVYLRQLAEFEADPIGFQAAMPAGFMLFADAIEQIEQAELNDQPLPDIKALQEQLPEDCPMPPWFLAAAAGADDPLGLEEAFPPGMLDGDPAMGQADKAGGFADPGNQAKLFDDIAKIKDDPASAVDVLKSIVSLLPPDKQGGYREGIDALATGLDQVGNDVGSDALANAAQNTEMPAEARPAAESYDESMRTANAELGRGKEVASTPDDVAKVTEAQGQLGQSPQTLDDAVAQGLAPLDEVELPDAPAMPDVEADLAAKSAKLEQDEARMRDKFGDHPLLGLFDLGRDMIANAPRLADVAPDLSELPAALGKAQEMLAAQGVSAAAMAPLAGLTAKVAALVEKLPQPEPLPDGEFVAQDLRNRDFSGQDLKGQSFCKSDLTAARFVGADLTGADFTKADLTKADLTGAILSDATMKGATLTKATLAEAIARGTILKDALLDEADFTAADLRGAKLTSARGAKVRFGKADLSEIDARFCDLSKADLRGATLRAANLSFATLNLVKGDGADFREAILDIVKLTKSRLHGAVFRGARSNMGSFTGSNLTGADLRECTFEKVDLMTTVLDDADATRAHLVGTTLRDTIANRTDFRHAVLTGSSATGAAQFLACDFRHCAADRSVWMDVAFTGSTFRHATFANAWFDGAHGTDIDFTAATMKHANFRKVRFTRVSFACADLASTVFQDATLDDGDFQRSNCYDAKLLGAKAIRCRFEHAFLVGVQLDDPDQATPGQPAPE